MLANSSVQLLWTLAKGICRTLAAVVWVQGDYVCGFSVFQWFLFVSLSPTWYSEGCYSPLFPLYLIISWKKPVRSLWSRILDVFTVWLRFIPASLAFLDKYLTTRTVFWFFRSNKTIPVLPTLGSTPRTPDKGIVLVHPHRPLLCFTFLFMPWALLFPAPWELDPTSFKVFCSILVVLWCSLQWGWGGTRRWNEILGYLWAFWEF